MTDEDRVRWDDTYVERGPAPAAAVALPAAFAAFTDLFPTVGHALDLACGQGLCAVWLARRGMDVWGLDVSPVAVSQARNLAHRCGVSDHCEFDIADLDRGLPTGPLADVIVCHRFRDRRLDGPIARRLAPGGLLAIAALSEVDSRPGPFRVAGGELPAAFADLAPIATGEGQGRAWLLARR